MCKCIDCDHCVPEFEISSRGAGGGWICTAWLGAMPESSLKDEDIEIPGECKSWTPRRCVKCGKAFKHRKDIMGYTYCEECERKHWTRLTAHIKRQDVKHVEE